MEKHSLHYALALALVAGLPCVPLPVQSEPVDMVLGTGHLNVGTYGLFNFTLEQNVGVGDSLTLGTIGSNFDTEIAVYDAHGQLVATNDDIDSRNKASLLSFGAGKPLSAGNYTAVLSSFNTIFRNGDIIPGTTRAGDFQLSLHSTQPVLTPSVPSYVAVDGNLLPGTVQETELGFGWVDAFGVQRLDFVLQDDILDGDWLVIHTVGSGFDTEIGLYNAQGKLVATNDDVSPNNKLSRLSFGLDGDNGRGLIAGVYTLLLGGFNTIFRDGLVAASSMSQGGDYAVYAQSSSRVSMVGVIVPMDLVVPEPESIYLVALGAVLLLRRRASKGLAIDL